MQTPRIPENEDQRLDALRRLDVLDTPAEERFDRITRIAQRHFQVPIALVSLVDAERQWFKSRQGLDACETSRGISFCGHAVLAEDIFYIPNALEDPRFADNPLVTGGPAIRFYAGAPLHAPDGQRIGTLCIIDDKPRTFTPDEFTVLRDLAGCVEAELARTRLLAAARESARLAMVAERTDNAVIITDAQGLIEWVNQGFERISGFTLAEVCGKKPGAVLQGPETDPDTVALMREKIQAGEAFQTEVLNYHRSGTPYWLSLSIQPIFEQGRLTQFIAIESDITERKAAEAELSRFKHVLDSTLDMIFMFDAETLRFIYLNTGAVQSMGYAREELLQLHPYDIKPLVPESAFRQLIKSLLAGEQDVLHFETVHRRRDGTDFPVEIFLQLVRENEGAGRFIAIVRDITDRKHIEAELRSSENRFRAVIDTVVEGIVTIDARGTVRAFNPAAERIFGYQADQVIGCNVNMLMPDPYHSAHDSYLHNYLATGNRKIIGIGREVTGRRQDGSTFPMDLSVSEMEVNGERMFTGIVRDITERKRLDRMKSEFVSTVSHELRTPLTSICGALGLVLGKSAAQLPDKTRRMLEMAQRNSERLTILINDLLDIEKIESGSLELDLKPVELVALARRAVEDNEGYASKHRVKLRLDTLLRQATVCGDAHRLLQVFANLISNAVKYSMQDGVVEISITAHGRSFRVAVRDHGMGIPEAFRDRIFQRFAQADSSDTREKGGTGLGLSITKAIVERHQGSIDYASASGTGTVFHFDLPGMQTELTEHPDSEAGIRVLICEDNPEVATILAEMLRPEGVVSDIAATAAAARALLAKQAYRLLLLDLSLPDADGLQFLQELRALPATANLPVIIVSGRAEAGRVGFAGDAVAVIDWLQKPVDRVRLEKALREALRRTDRPRILHVEDDADIVQITQVLLEDMSELRHTSTVQGARELLGEQDFDLVILDLGLADGSGLELLDELKGRCPVVIFSAQAPGREISEQVSAALTKSMTSNEKLVETIKQIFRGRH